MGRPANWPEVINGTEDCWSEEDEGCSAEERFCGCDISAGDLRCLAVNAERVGMWVARWCAKVDG